MEHILKPRPEDIKTFSAGRFTDYCGIVFEEVRTGYCRTSAVVTESHMNLIGYAHGGFAATVLDTTAGMAVRYARDDFRKSVTSSCDIHYIRPILEGSEISCEAKIISAGNTMARVEAKLFCGEQLMSCGTFSFVYIEK